MDVKREGTTTRIARAVAVGAKDHRRDVAVLVTLLIGLAWLVVGSTTMDGIPLAVAGCLILPNTFYVVNYFRS